LVEKTQKTGTNLWGPGKCLTSRRPGNLGPEATSDREKIRNNYIRKIRIKRMKIKREGKVMATKKE